MATPFIAPEPVLRAKPVDEKRFHTIRLGLIENCQATKSHQEISKRLKTAWLLQTKASHKSKRLRKRCKVLTMQEG